MKERSIVITARVLGLCFFSVIVCIALYCGLLPLALGYDRAMTVAFVKRMLTVGLAFDFLCTFVVYLVYRPAARAMRTLDRGGALSEAEFAAAGKALNRIPSFLFAFGAFSYAFAYGINLSLDAIAGAFPSAEQIVSRVAGAVSFGILNGVLCERLMNLEFMRIKMRLGIVHLSQLSVFQRYSSLFSKLFTPAVTLFVFIIAFGGIAFLNLSRDIARATVEAASAAAAGGAQAAVDAAQAAASSSYRSAALSAIIVFGGLLCSSIVIFSVFIRETSRNMSTIRSQLETQGESVDLSKRIFITSNDDIGYLGAGINDLMERISGTFSEVRSMSEEVLSSSQEAARLVEQSRGVAESITSSLERVETSNGDEATHIADLAIGIEGMTKALARYAEGAADQSRSATDAMDSVRLFVESFETARRESAASESFYRELGEAIAKAGGEIDKAKNAAIDTVAMGQRVSGIVSTIVDIADRSSLLAMNASIEAAHAGTAGKGFAVVAKEIKAMAESSSVSSAGIVEQIKAMQEKNTAGAGSIDELVASFDLLRERIEAAGRKASEQASSYRERSDLATIAMRGLSGLLDGIRHMEADAVARLDDQKGIEGSIQKLERVTQTLATETEELFAGVKEVLRISVALDEDMGKNSDAARALDSRMASYRLKE
ncbi:MAG: hypothetical protein CVV47_12110 [Spirochaetae bacterium HGW-Spirochaetae-3]|jgi:methyl-accepting chemotaxis protein|nr:MAG: hypothetical protein CVV47_12110 [Spirochaetae bacterium HGW-Spirochaetae-3]